MVDPTSGVACHGGSDLWGGLSWWIMVDPTSGVACQPNITSALRNCSVWLVDVILPKQYAFVKNNCGGGIIVRKYYLDNIRWITVVIVVLYHVIYMYNAEGIPGVCGKITDLEVQYFDVFQYIVYPWFMMLLFMVSGIPGSARGSIWTIIPTGNSSAAGRRSFWCLPR